MRTEGKGRLGSVHVVGVSVEEGKERCAHGGNCLDIFILSEGRPNKPNWWGKEGRF